MKIKQVFKKLPSIKPNKEFENRLYYKIISGYDGGLKSINNFRFLKYLIFSLSLNLIFLIIIYIFQATHISLDLNTKENFIQLNNNKLATNYSVKINTMFSDEVILPTYKMESDDLISVTLPPGYYYAEIVGRDGDSTRTPLWVSSLI